MSFAPSPRVFGSDFARDTEVFLIEARTLDFGIGLSAPVEAGVAQVVTEIEQMLRRHVRHA